MTYKLITTLLHNIILLVTNHPTYPPLQGEGRSSNPISERKKKKKKEKEKEKEKKKKKKKNFFRALGRLARARHWSAMAPVLMNLRQKQIGK